MTTGLINVAVQMFSQDFINVYQYMQSPLPATIQTVRGIVGLSYTTKVAGQLTMHDRGAYQSNIPPSAVTYTPVTVLFNDKIAKFPSDIFEQANVNASERLNLAKKSADAISRQETQIIIDELDAASGTGTVAAGGVNLTVEKVLEAKAFLDRNNVPPSGRTALIHANTLQGFLSETQTTNANYNSVRTLVSGEINTFLGFKFITIGDLIEGGLPFNVGTNTRTVYFYHEDSLLGAYGVLDRTSNPGIETAWSFDSQSWLIIPKLRMGAKTVLANGIVKVDCVEPA